MRLDDGLEPRHSLRWVLALCSVVLTLTACSSAGFSASARRHAHGRTVRASTVVTPKLTCSSGSIGGAGSSFVETLAQQWINQYEATCQGATVVYDAVGSTTGVQLFIAGGEDFGASDFFMSSSDLQAVQSRGGSVVQIPWAAGGVALEYKLAGVLQLRLSAPTIAAIFSGQVTQWNDPRIEQSNPGVRLPSEPIQVVHRSDGSGTTNALTSYMSMAAPSVWADPPGKTWPSTVGQGARGSDGVTQVVRQTEGAIGYAELSFAVAGHLGVAEVENPSGVFVAPDAASVTAAIQAATIRPDGTLALSFTPTDPGAYPISTTTQAIVLQDQPTPAKADLLRSFLSYAVTAGQSYAAQLGYAPLTTSLVTKDLAEISTIRS